MMVRNERVVLPASLRHLLDRIGADIVLVADNGSTDGTRMLLDRLARSDSRLRWTDASGPYAQSEIVTGLAREAHRMGATWILPTDADEFHWLPPAALAEWKQSRGVGAWIVGITNFVQWRWVRKDRPGAIAKMIFSADPIGSPDEAKQLVESGAIASVQVRATKLILRSAADLIIHKGNHGADGISGAIRELAGATLLHAQLRARDVLAARIEKAERLPSSLPAEYSWHLRRLPYIDLDAEWRANSTRFGEIGPDGRKSRLRLDLRLRRCVLGQLSS